MSVVGCIDVVNRKHGAHIARQECHTALMIAGYLGQRNVGNTERYTHPVRHS
ncbi:MAG TPA: hypothetical protein VLK82_18865 [Candidatus Tectomicrobia bacterium]|nr:hypothetical protein [Candidatus Tectomicrobia bacterium]